MLSLSNCVSFVGSRRIILLPQRHSTRSRRTQSAGGFTLGTFPLLWALVAALVCASETQARPQGLAGRRTEIVVRTSPSVYLPGPSLSVEVTSLKPVTQRVPELIQQKIQDTLIKNDPRLGITTGSPDTLIQCTIADLGYSSGVEARTRQEYQKTGEMTVTDPTTGATSTMDQYGYVDVPYRALVFNARLSVKCEVKDVATGVVLYSDRFDPVYSDPRDVVAGARSDDLNEVYLRLAGEAADLILAQLSPRIYAEIVELPSRKLKEASKLLEANSWNEALRLLTATPPFKDQKDEAYRLYSIGIAQEALAYSAPSGAERKRILEQAVNNYRIATELKPREDAFWAPKNRAESLLWQAARLAAQVEAFNEAKKAGSTVAAPGNTDLFHQVRSKMRPAHTALTNDDVVQLVKAGRSSDYIAANIRHAPETKFKLYGGEVLKLRREGVKDVVVKAMIEKQHGPRYGPGLGKFAIIMSAIGTMTLVMSLALVH